MHAFIEISSLSMPTTTFYFIRHGETDYNRQRIVQGRRIDSTLNATGRAQAEALAERFAGETLDVIYSSTLQRARETATAIAKHHPGVPVHHLADLEEMSWGIYEGRSSSPDMRAVFDAMYERWSQGDYATAFEEGESILDVQRRGLRAVETIMEQHEGQRVLVVAHGRFLRVLLASLLPEYGLERMQEIEHTNTAVNHLVCEAGTYRAERLNCTVHLESAELIMVE